MLLRRDRFFLSAGALLRVILAGMPYCSSATSWRGALALLAGALVSCGAFDAYHQARSGAAAVLSCPESELRQAHTSRSSAYYYRFEGCGRSTSMSCTSSASSGQVMCMPEP